jgi:RNA 2',3'-cyclic 3'-phosphodiesterase
MREPFFRRYFLALRPPRAIAAEMGFWRDSFLFGGRKVADDRLHMTLFMLGDFERAPGRLLVRVGAALSGASLPGCRIVLDRLTGGHGSALLAPGEPLPGLGKMQARLAETLARSDVQAAPWWRFSQHVTLLYDHSYAGECPIDPIGWTAAELLLIESRVGRGEHVRLDAWPLDRALISA